MSSLKRAFASFGLIAVMCVSGTALADEVDDTETLAEETVVTLTEDGNAQDSTESTPVDEPEDTATIAPEGDADSNGDAEDTVANPDAENEDEVSEPAKDDDSVCKVWVSDKKGYETMSVSIEGKELLSVDTRDVSLGPWDEPLPTFVEKGTIPVWKFEKLFAETKVPDFSDYQGKHKVSVLIEGTTGKVSCADEGKEMAKSAAWRHPYEFTVDFSEHQPECVATHTTEGLSKVKIGDTYLEVQGDLDLYDKDAQGSGRSLLLEQANYRGSMAFEDFEKILKDFNKDIDLSAIEGEQNVELVYTYGSTCRFVDQEYGDGLGGNWLNNYAFTVDFPVKAAPAQQAQPSQSTQQAPAQQASRTSERPQVQPAANSARNTVAPAQAPAPAANPVLSDDSVNVDNEPEPQDPPKLPVTGSKKAVKDDKASEVAAFVNEDAESSHAALFALAACFGFGIVAAVSVIAIRRLRD